MAALRRMFQTPRSCSASAVSSTSSHSHLLLFCFSQTKLLQFFFFFQFGCLVMKLCEILLAWECLYFALIFGCCLARCRILCSKSGVGKLWPKLVKSSPSLVLVNEGLQKHSHAHFFMDIMAAFVLHWQSWIVTKKTTWPTKCEIFTIFPLKGKVCLPFFKIIITQNVEILLHFFLLMRALRALLLSSVVDVSLIIRQLVFFLFGGSLGFLFIFVYTSSITRFYF